MTQWNTDQLEVIDAFNRKESLIVSSVAGSGKTTLLVDLAKRSAGKVLLLAYNKRIQLELQKRLAGTKATVLTFSSLGLLLLRKKLPQIKVSTTLNFKLWKKQKEVCNNYGVYEKETLFFQNRLALWDKSLAYDGLSLNPSTLNQFLSLLTEEAEKGVIDFTGMLSLPVVFNLNHLKYDTVLIDEYQDLTNSQISLAQLVSHKNTQTVFVGDQRQAIYSFLGVDLNNSATIKSVFAPIQEYSIRYNYRCCNEILSIAQKYNSIVTSGNPFSGLVEYATEVDLTQTQTILASKFTLLLDSITDALLAKIPMILVGCNLPINELLNTATYQQTIIELTEKTKLELKQTPRLLCTSDKIRQLQTTIAFYGAVYHMDQKSLSFLQSDNPRLIFSTIHKSKGLEWDNVTVFIDANTFESDELESQNLSYVALTRAKKIMRLIDA